VNTAHANAERCPACHRPKGDTTGKKRPARYCWLQHDDSCRAAELYVLRECARVVELARILISTPRGTPEHLAAELGLVAGIAAIDVRSRVLAWTIDHRLAPPELEDDAPPELDDDATPARGTVLQPIDS
jgi:hypothetical protein